VIAGSAGAAFAVRSGTKRYERLGYVERSRPITWTFLVGIVGVLGLLRLEERAAAFVAIGCACFFGAAFLLITVGNIRYRHRQRTSTSRLFASPPGWDDLSLKEQVLVRGLDDWVYAADVYGIAAGSGLAEPSAIRELSLGLTSEILVEGLMVAGEVDGTGHRPWEMSTGDAIVRITEDWLEWTEQLTPGAVVWLDLTETGRALAKDALRRQRDL
jgi:hypothetical protein